MAAIADPQDVTIKLSGSGAYFKCPVSKNIDNVSAVDLAVRTFIGTLEQLSRKSS
jgi:hypothetical protein